MTDKELRKLHREDLLQILITQQRQIDDLNAALEDSEAALNDKKIAIEESGSIAEAVLRINNVFTSAQMAADRYMEEMRTRADGLVADAEKSAENIVKQARAEAERILKDARRQAGQPVAEEEEASQSDKSKGGLFRRKSGS